MQPSLANYIQHRPAKSWPSHAGHAIMPREVDELHVAVRLIHAVQAAKAPTNEGHADTNTSTMQACWQHFWLGLLLQFNGRGWATTGPRCAVQAGIQVEQQGAN